MGNPEDTDDDFEVVEALDQSKVDNMDQGYKLLIGNEIRLDRYNIAYLKAALDWKFEQTDQGADYPVPPVNPINSAPRFSISSEDARRLNVNPGVEKKLEEIPVTVEQVNGRVIVKIGPHDLSGVGGIRIRENIIKHLVKQALDKKGITNKTYDNVDVCANISVRDKAIFLL